MNKFYSVFFIFLVLFLTTCQKPDHDDSVTPVNPPINEKPIPEGSRMVEVMVEGNYDLSQAIGTTVLDSVSMKSEAPKLIVPKGYSSVVYFLDEETNDVLAVVRADSLGSEININAESVANALYDLLPAYHDLSSEMQKKFETEVISTEAYKNFISTVDDLLKNNRPVYSTDPIFLKQLRELNLFIIASYFNDIPSKAERVKMGNPGDIKSWLKKDENLIENQVYSYVQVDLTRESGLKNTYLMDQRPYTFGQTTQSLSALNDDYYNVVITQSSDEVILRNQKAAVSKIVSTALSQVFGVNNPNADCYKNISLAIEAEVLGILVGEVSKTDQPTQIVSSMLAGAANAIGATLGSSSTCIAKLLFKAIISKLNWASKAYELVWLGTDIVQIAGFISALHDPVELSESMQIYNGKLIPGQVSFLAKGVLKEEHLAEESAIVESELLVDHFYDEVEKSGFQVKWKVADSDSDQGIVSPSMSSTSAIGVANTNWTMPTEGGRKVVMMAEILDKEGDHLHGSPITFSTNVICPTPISMSFLGINNIEIIPQGDTLTYKNYSMDFKFDDPCNMIGNSQEAYLRIIWTNESNGIPNPFDHSLKGYAGQIQFEASYGGSTHWYRDRTTGNYCCYTNYTYELFIDGKSYGSASAAGPGPQ